MRRGPSIEVAAQRPDKEWVFLPALALLALVVFLQLGRLRRQPDGKPVPARA